VVIPPGITGLVVLVFEALLPPEGALVSDDDDPVLEFVGSGVILVLSATACKVRIAASSALEIIYV
jgi:hypothetical protein